MIIPNTQRVSNPSHTWVNLYWYAVSITYQGDINTAVAFMSLSNVIGPDVPDKVRCAIDIVLNRPPWK